MEMNPGEPDDALLARAARELMAHDPEPRWVDVSNSVLARVRATTRRTWPVDAAFPGESAVERPDTLRISDHIVRTTLRRALLGVHGAEPIAIDLQLDGHTCIGAAITVTGVYGTDLHAVGRELGDLAHSALTGLLGLPIADAAVTVHFEDITDA
ncbi:hypothetical protein [Rhodococcoides kyotonense]|uniref:Asp23/Gls24 family envelope stress response protein n=1 Tax=Rhodococcoides kyotonense TaxID=398843 RepID=A0A239MEB2_9NOCA|nr:hypothetical protein [Rhodococcus kyotonensis]SNT40991.1 hypothetical protein SAMN05421642_117111 [Rhodococcus kyotonensis]